MGACAPQGMITGNQGLGEDDGVDTNSFSVLETIDGYTAVVRCMHQEASDSHQA